MRTNRRVYIAGIGFAVFCLLSRGISGAKDHSLPSAEFRINTHMPYAYLEVDHIGPRVPLTTGEPTIGIFIWLRNNSRLPIVIPTFNLGPKANNDGEVGVADEIVKLPKCRIECVGVPNDVGRPLFQAPAASGEKSPNASDESPEGYESPFADDTVVPAGKSVYFSLPVNHVGSKWFARIPIRIQLPNDSKYPDPQTYIILTDGELRGK